MGTRKVINFATEKNIQQHRTAADRENTGMNKMKKSEYKEKSATAEGRKNLHGELITEIKNRMDAFVSKAPEANKAKVSALFTKAIGKLENEGNSILFEFFAAEDINDRDFIKHIQETLNDK